MCLWLKPDAVWERAWAVSKGLHDPSLSIKWRSTHSIPLSNQTALLDALMKGLDSNLRPLSTLHQGAHPLLLCRVSNLCECNPKHFIRHQEPGNTRSRQWPMVTPHPAIWLCQGAASWFLDISPFTSILSIKVLNWKKLGRTWLHLGKYVICPKPTLWKTFLF